MYSKIKWSSNAEKNYDATIKQLTKTWGDKIVKSFIGDVNSLLISLSKFNKLCSKSKLKGIRKCVISKQISLVYKIKGSSIYLVAFVPNRSDHKY